MTVPQISRQLDAFLGEEHRLLIGGEWSRGTANLRISSVDPSTERVIGEVIKGSQADVNTAVDAARTAQPGWDTLGYSRRCQILNGLADTIERHADELAMLEALDSGNPIRAMRDDIPRGAERIREICALASAIRGETLPAEASGLHYTLHEPYGVVGVIIPFNHPARSAMTKIIPPLITGNTVVLKPAEQTPLTALYLGNILRESLPPGVINIVTGDGETGAAVVRSPAIKRIAFTGSVRTGQAIQQTAAEVGIKHITLELGGKNPMIVFPDADVESAAQAVITGMNLTVCQGQSCMSNSRVFAHEAVYGDLIGRIAKAMGSLRVGIAYDPETEMGPLVDRRQYDRVSGFIESGLAQRADLKYGGKRPPYLGSDGYFLEPTLFADVDVSSTIAQEEIFGPVVCMFRWSEWDEVIHDANSVTYGLTASIWTRDLATAHRTVRRLEAGYVWINRHGGHRFGIPFGGYKSSGVGREGSLQDLASYMEIKAVHVSLP